MGFCNWEITDSKNVQLSYQELFMSIEHYRLSTNYMRSAKHINKNKTHKIFDIQIHKT